MKKVISTLSSDTNFVDHATGRGVLVRGVAVMPNPNSFLGYGMGQWAPAVTDVSEDDAKFLPRTQDVPAAPGAGPREV